MLASSFLASLDGHSRFPFSRIAIFIRSNFSSHPSLLFPEGSTKGERKRGGNLFAMDASSWSGGVAQGQVSISTDLPANFKNGRFCEANVGIGKNELDHVFFDEFFGSESDLYSTIDHGSFQYFEGSSTSIDSSSLLPYSSGASQMISLDSYDKESLLFAAISGDSESCRRFDQSRDELVSQDSSNREVLQPAKRKQTNSFVDASKRKVQRTLDSAHIRFDDPEHSRAIGQMKEMVYRAAALRPVSLGAEEAAAEKRPRKNVKTSSDPQTVAARLRRERVSERLRVLQKLVPGGSKMDTASMLDEACNYLKFLKSQIRTLGSSISGGRTDHYYYYSMTPGALQAWHSSRAQ